MGPTLPVFGPLGLWGAPPNDLGQLTEADNRMRLRRGMPERPAYSPD